MTEVRDIAGGGVRTLPSPAGRGYAQVRSLLTRYPELVTAVLCLAVVLSGVHGPDFPAQQFRVWLFRRHGALLWNDQWYAGHPVTGYSLIFPPVAAAFGTTAVGVASCIASVTCLRLLLKGVVGAGVTAALLWFSVAIVGDLVVGRLPFALGTALGLAALLAIRRGASGRAALLAALSSLASPLAGAFLLLVGVALAASVGWRRVAPLAVAAVGLATATFFGGGGVFPFPWTTLLVVAAFVGLALLFAPSRYRSLRRAVTLYGSAAVPLFALPNPVGGNLARLGALVAGPVAAFVLLNSGRRRLLLLLTGPLLCWQLSSVTTAVADSNGDASAQRAYYTGLLRYLAAHHEPLGRVEIPLTRDHWETAYVAAHYPMARGWERQLDIEYNAVLYSRQLNPASYRQWLRANGVRWVALPDVPLDPAAQAEASLLRSGRTGLLPRWHDRHWTLWEVPRATPLLAGPATLDGVGISGFRVTFRSAGAARLLVHYNRFWHVDSGRACISSTDAGWTAIAAVGPGTVTVGSQLSMPHSEPVPVCLRELQSGGS